MVLTDNRRNRRPASRVQHDVISIVSECASRGKSSGCSPDQHVLRVYHRRNRRRVVGLPATHAGKRSLALSTCASLDQKPAPGGQGRQRGSQASQASQTQAGPAQPGRLDFHYILIPQFNPLTSRVGLKRGIQM